VLLLHGIPTSAALWRHVQPSLAREADTIAVDLLGYGDSSKPDSPEPSLPVQARLLGQLLLAWDLRDVLVVGHDIGGGVAQLLALAAPDRVSGLVLIDSIAYDSFPEPTIARLSDPSWDERIQHVDLAAGLRRSLTKGLSSRDDKAIDDLAQLYAAPFDGPAGRAAYLRAARALHTSDLAEAMPAVEKLPIPVRLIWGEDDLFQPVQNAQRLARALPCGELVVIPGACHFLPEDRPSLLAGLLLIAVEETRST
jgi:pimeloyl-ACP methyl ester carboxylesterase